jgi:hypothetical protein
VLHGADRHRAFRYNALVRRLVSFERAAERAPADANRIQDSWRLGAAADARARVYFTGGATAVLLDGGRAPSTWT